VVRNVECCHRFVAYGNAFGIHFVDQMRDCLQARLRGRLAQMRQERSKLRKGHPAQVSLYSDT